MRDRDWIERNLVMKELVLKIKQVEFKTKRLLRRLYASDLPYGKRARIKRIKQRNS